MSRAAARLSLRRSDLPILIFFHGYALAHTIRPLVMARALRDRGYPVVLAGRGPHVVRIRQEGFDVHDVETLPQCRMDQYVRRGDYSYYTPEWIDRCVTSERLLISLIRPALVLHEMKPTAHLSARLEGVDDARITQAYNHPAYPHKLSLVEGLTTSPGPFDDYLAAHADEVQRQQSFYLLADRPELHPVRRESAGYSFVGPLLDRTPEPARLDVLDEGWDTDLPLVYLTCGSSGLRPDYLDDLVPRLRHKPYRVLITTANRWDPSTTAHHPDAGSGPGRLPPNVRVVPFLSGEWILRRAEMLVGVVGIGAIYQALAQGKPIIGAPEHLDQEYHLNRVRDLGLGIKLDRRDFDADHILQAIDTVLEQRQAFRERCAPFVDVLQEVGGETAVDRLDDFFQNRGKEYTTSGAYLISGDEFIRYLDASTPASLDATRIRQLLLRGARRGMPHRWVGKGLYFDRYDSWNWLYDNEPEFFQADYRAGDERRQRFLQVRDHRVRPRESWQRLRLTYRLRIDPRGADGTPLLRAGERLKLFLPYPVERKGQQSAADLEHLHPVHLEGHLLPQMGFVYGAEIEVTSEEAPIEVGYRCAVSVRAQELCDARPTPLNDAERDEHTEIDERLRNLPERLALRSRLGLADLPDDESRARAIYRDLCTTKRFRKTRDASASPRYATAAVLRSAGGHCTSLARAFASLCRAEGIPTREVTGALLGHPAGDNAFELRTYGESMFGHTWVEIWLEQRGWIPVEFHGIAIGATALTKRNVNDRHLRRQIEASTIPWLDYYFGSLDNHRVLGSPSVKSAPLIMGAVEQPAAGERPWAARADLRFDCLLRAEID
jgi:UDP:flavonoid glycosyltransferase YjiC (YdhE family)